MLMDNDNDQGFILSGNGHYPMGNGPKTLNLGHKLSQKLERGRERR